MKPSEAYRKAAEILDTNPKVSIPEYALLLLHRSGEDQRLHSTQLSDFAEFLPIYRFAGRTKAERNEGVIGLLLLAAISEDEERHGQA